MIRIQISGSETLVGDAFSIPDFQETRIAARMHKLKAEKRRICPNLFVCVQKICNFESILKGFSFFSRKDVYLEISKLINV